MPMLIENRKVYFDYEVLEKFEAGLVLVGWEVKSLRNKRGNIAGSHIIIRGGEAFIVGISIPPYQAKNLPADFEENRTIKILLSKKEINYLAGKTHKTGLTMVPLKLYTKGRKIKMEIALVKGKKKFDKRETIKKREDKRKIERAIKSR
jgi:SsrA-binding protein